jgi:L-malate glycosyltransferase
VGDGPRRGGLLQEAGRLGLPIWSADAGTDAPSLPSSVRKLPSPQEPGAAVRFFGHRSDAREVMAGFDVAVLSSHMGETQPLSLIEAMDAGLPVVATRVGAVEEMIEEEGSGFLVPAGDEVALSEVLTRLLQDASLRNRLGARGQAIASERYSVEAMVAATAKLLSDLLA